jgi:glycosyltransferase involved in cell wall biosynthesis
MSQLIVIENTGLDQTDAVIKTFNELNNEIKKHAAYLLLIGFSVDTTFRVRQRLSQNIHEEKIFAITAQDQQLFKDTLAQAGALCIQRWLEQYGITLLWLPGNQQVIPATFLHNKYPQRPWAKASVKNTTETRPKLAFISPLPPEQTGIANYNSKLLPLLTPLYEVTAVVQQAQICNSISSSTGISEILSADNFRQVAHRFDRLVYHIGNSLFHAWQFDLLKQHPGLVVLHDYFLFDAIWWQENTGIFPFGIKRSLYENHGFPALIEAKSSELSRGPDHFPVNGAIVNEAAGLVLHSRHARALHKHWYPDYPDQFVNVLPLYRDIPKINPDKAGIRSQLGLNQDTVIIASFGGISAKKGTDLLVRSFLSTRFTDAPDVKLVLIGAVNTGSFGKQLKKYIQTHPEGSRILITGYTEKNRYECWLQTADMAVQLRKDTRGESSGTLFDVMAHGICAVVNAHGSNAEVPPECVWQLPESPSLDTLSTALKTLANDPQKRAILGSKAREWVTQTLNAGNITRRYYEAIENSMDHPIRREYRWLNTLAAELQVSNATGTQISALVKQLAPLNLLNRRSTRRILFDVSALTWNDRKTGIERVTREIAIQLLKSPPSGYHVALIHWWKETFYTHPSYAGMLQNISTEGLTSRPVEATAGDLYLSVEWSPPIMEQAQEEMGRMRARGVRFYFTVHDLLPILMPNHFPAGTDQAMQSWFNRVMNIADGIICDSKCVAKDVQGLSPQARNRKPPYIRVFCPGSDFGNNTAPLTEDETRIIEQLKRVSMTRLLMVGTLEPRKGHHQVLDAMEHLWKKNREIALIIVGKQGWNVDALISKLTAHPESNHRLYWLQGCSDALLKAVYHLSDGLIAASYGEGFGLPLVEAAQCKLPVLARDIAVFREVAQHYASFFTADTADDMACAIEHYVAQIKSSDMAERKPPVFNSWKQSAHQLMAEILNDPALADFRANRQTRGNH